MARRRLVYEGGSACVTAHRGAEDGALARRGSRRPDASLGQRTASRGQPVVATRSLMPCPGNWSSASVAARQPGVLRGSIFRARAAAFSASAPCGLRSVSLANVVLAAASQPGALRVTNADARTSVDPEPGAVWPVGVLTAGQGSVQLCRSRQDDRCDGFANGPRTMTSESRAIADRPGISIIFNLRQVQRHRNAGGACDQGSDR